MSLPARPASEAAQVFPPRNERANSGMHVALLGDSILDNHAYTKGAPDVAGHLRQLLPGSAQATLCAVDGSTTSDLNLQIGRVPSDTSHIVISIGGNDALLNSDLLSTPVASTTEALSLFAKRIAQWIKIKWMRLRRQSRFRPARRRGSRESQLPSVSHPSLVVLRVPF